jgi:hypothetical protein
MAGNALVGGIIGLGVDAGTGAYNSLYPNPVSVHLVPVSRDSRHASNSSSETPVKKQVRKTDISARTASE